MENVEENKTSTGERENGRKTLKNNLIMTKLYKHRIWIFPKLQMRVCYQ